jgi:hypothetical protein
MGPALGRALIGANVIAALQPLFSSRAAVNEMAIGAVFVGAIVVAISARLR